MVLYQYKKLYRVSVALILLTIVLSIASNRLIATSHFNSCLEHLPDSEKNICRQLLGIDNNLPEYTVYEQLLEGESTEGGNIKVFYDGQKVKKVYKSLFFEMGNVQKGAYFIGTNDIVIYILENQYDKPMYLEGFKIEKCNQYYLFLSGKSLTKLYSNGTRANFKSLDKFAVYHYNDLMKIIDKVTKDGKKGKTQNTQAIKNANLFVLKVENKIKSGKFYSFRLNIENIQYDFYYNNTSLVKTKISIRHKGYAHHFSYYFDETENIIKYLKETTSDKKLKKELDLERKAIIYGKSSSIVWANNLFKPPIKYIDIKRMFKILKSGNHNIHKY